MVSVYMESATFDEVPESLDCFVDARSSLSKALYLVSSLLNFLEKKAMGF